MLLLPKSFIETYKEDLDDEDRLEIMDLIFDWFLGLNSKTTKNKLVKVLFNNLLPILEGHKSNYKNGEKGGAPVGNTNAKKNNCETTNTTTETTKTTQTTPLVLENNPKEKEKEKENNTSKEVLFIIEEEKGKQETLDGVSVSGEEVSKGLEKLEDIFPSRKRDVGIDEINLWNSLSQNQKANLIKSASSYVRTESKVENGKWIKKMSKWIREEIDKGVKEEIKPVVKSNSKKTFKWEDGNIYGLLQDKLGSATFATTAYAYLNSAGFTKEQFREVVETTDKEDLLEMIR